jgi:predicted transcriptional regulator
MGQSISELFERAEDKRGYSVRRSQLEIQMDILKVVHEGAYLPTQIMYRANLAWVALQNSLGNLVGTGLLERTSVGGKRVYQLTIKGSSILTSFNQIMDAVQTPNALKLGGG